MIRQLLRSRAFRIGAIVGALALTYVLLFLASQIAAREWRTDTGELQALRKTNVISRGDSRQLVVLMHAYQQDADSMLDLIGEIKALEVFRDADLLVPEYNSSTFSNSDLFRIAGRLQEIIDRVARDRRDADGDGAGYEEIYLVGHSIGALLLRKAFIYGHGIMDDHPSAVSTVAKDKQAAREWVGKVDRFILLAGMNRGFDPSQPPPLVGQYPAWLLARAGLVLGQVTGTGHLIRGVLRGSPFVTNLRIQWIRLTAELGEGMPVVVQLLGDNDEWVNRHDHFDLLADVGFSFVPVSATHRSVVVLDESEPGRRRRDTFAEVLKLGRDELRREYPPNRGDYNIAEGTRVDHVVFIRHGIRDRADWTAKLEERIIQDAKTHKVAVRIDRGEYGYFAMIPFLIPSQRHKYVRLFMDDYTERLATHRDPQTKFSFIGHSHGTYLLGKALEDYKSLRIHNVAFAGSVVRTSYPWDKMVGTGNDKEPGRVNRFRNYMASADWVVAIFPKLFESFHISDLGSGGFDGFSRGNWKEVRVKGTHSAALAYLDSLSYFILTGEVDPEEKIAVAGKSGLLDLLSKLCFLVWAGLLAVTFALGYAGWWLLGRFVSLESSLRNAGYWTVYFILLLLILTKI